MTETIFENQYVRILYCEEKSLVETVWFRSTKNMSDSEYLEAIDQLFGSFTKYRPLKSIGGHRDFLFVIDPKIQSWIARAAVSLVPKYNGIVVSDEIFARMSAQQMFEEITYADNTIITKFFNSRSAAFLWLEQIKA
ncbi:hypothetical protein V6R21_16375 [Limibacter armeniacum]|uniref:hypothetical protein n=1 Tax=Limibacter armeniacum TaxID=466084 RepID=UPI002FE651D8